MDLLLAILLLAAIADEAYLHLGWLVAVAVWGLNQFPFSVQGVIRE